MEYEELVVGHLIFKWLALVFAAEAPMVKRYVIMPYE